MAIETEANAVEALVLQAQHGDPIALDQLLRDWHPRLLRFASGFLRDDDAARDVVQEALIKVTQRIRQLDRAAAFSSWAFTILRREAIEFLRQKKRKLDEATDFDDTALALQPANSGPGFDPSEEMRIGLQRLRNEDRNMLNLHYWCGFDVKEIAAILGIAAGAVKTRLFRARNRLREQLCEPDLSLAFHQ